MARWTEEDISTFFRMRDNGATLKEIAEVLGRTLSSVEQKSFVLNQSKEDNKMREATEATEVTDAPKMEAKKPEVPSLDITIQQMLAMIRGQGMEFSSMDLSLTSSDASVVLRFRKREVRGCTPSQAN